MDDVRGNFHLRTPSGERIIRLTDGSLILGRALECDVVIHDTKVSRRHLRIDISAEAIAVTDLGSSSGMTVDGFKVAHATLADGSTIVIGECSLRLERFGGAPPGIPAEGEEYIEVKSGDPEPTIVESLRPGEVTVSHDGLQQAFNDTSVPRLTVFSQTGGVEYPLTRDVTVLGRDEGADIVLTDAAASRRHASLERRDDRVVLRDLESKNGTWLRDRPVTMQVLESGSNFRIGDTFFVYKAGFPHDAVTLPPAQAADEGGRRPVVVLPGIMGSELNDEHGMLWPNLSRALREPARMAVGGGHDLKLGSIARQIIVVPGFIKLDAYSELVDYLEKGLGYESGKDLLEFPYDWRQDNRESAEKLRAAIDRWRKESLRPNQKVTILCHSMGALVSRYYLECLGGSANVEKFVTIGGAHFGAPFMVRGLLYGPDLLPLGIGRKGLHEALLSMPSAYQLLPQYPAAYGPNGKLIDLHKDTSWAKPAYRHLVRGAREFHEEIGKSISVPTTCIFGYGVKTVTRIQVDELGADGWKKVRFVLEHAGDNRVAERYSYLDGADIHPVKQYHGCLWNDNDVKMRIRLELLKS
jgi:pSer/pThr/pTyr-binding forkhead associated (FHA) protein